MTTQICRGKPRCLSLAALTFLILSSLYAATASAEGLPKNAEDFQQLLASVGWKTLAGPDGSIYLYPPAHPYAHLDQPSQGKWSDIPPPGSRS